MRPTGTGLCVGTWFSLARVCTVVRVPGSAAGDEGMLVVVMSVVVMVLSWDTVHPYVPALEGGEVWE